MATQGDLYRVPRDIKFRMLVIGRANAGMTSMLPRVCETTESPEVYRLPSGRRGNLLRVPRSTEFSPVPDSPMMELYNLLQESEPSINRQNFVRESFKRGPHLAYV